MATEYRVAPATVVGGRNIDPTQGKKRTYYIYSLQLDLQFPLFNTTLVNLISNLMDHHSSNGLLTNIRTIYKSA